MEVNTEMIIYDLLHVQSRHLLTIIVCGRSNKKEVVGSDLSAP